MDTEGRFIQADFGKLSIVSLYLPSGEWIKALKTYHFDLLGVKQLFIEKC